MKSANRRQTIMFAVLGLLVVVFLGPKVLGGGGGGGGGEGATSATTTTLALSTPTTAGPDATTPVEPGPDEPFSVFATRNPFEPVTGGGTPNDDAADDSDTTVPEDSSPANPVGTTPSTGDGTETPAGAVGSFDPTP